MVNIMVCGTPGTGKSSLIEKIDSELTEFKFINLSKFAIENGCILDYDNELETSVIDEHKLLKLLKPQLEDKKLNNVFESIHGNIFPNHLIDLIFVCRADTSELYDRLNERKYNEFKITNNIEAEIFQTILDEVKESFDSSKIVELVNNNYDDLEKNCRIFTDKTRAEQKDQQ